MNAERVSQVLARLATVTDPELDEPVTELGFVDGVTVDEAGRVEIGFRLPTYWCAANFAFLMADDMRQAVTALPWVSKVGVALDAHMYADTINQAMAKGQSFQDAFAGEADGDLDDVRRIFAMKAFQRRQLVLLDHLTASGHTLPDLLAMSIADLQALAGDATALIKRYLEKRAIPGPADPAQRAFVDEHAQPIAEATYGAHRRTLRRTAVNVEFNGALCRGLLSARYGADNTPPAAEPTLHDFIRGVVPERPAA